MEMYAGAQMVHVFESMVNYQCKKNEPDPYPAFVSLVTVSLRKIVLHFYSSLAERRNSSYITKFKVWMSFFLFFISLCNNTLLFCVVLLVFSAILDFQHCHSLIGREAV